MKKARIIILVAGLSLSLFTKANNVLPQELPSTYWKALEYFQEENYAKSAQLFQALLKTDSTNVDFNFYTGMCLFRLKDLKNAKIYFVVATKDDFCRLKVRVFLRMEGMDDSFLL